MNFDQVIRQVVGALDAHGVRYALIGGFAMALRGVQRATMDLDFILMLEDMGKADEIITGCGYRRVFHSANVSHYVSPAEDWGESISCMLSVDRPWVCWTAPKRSHCGTG
jgi:hypothetical protein